jgi:hypothetical protein
LTILVFLTYKAIRPLQKFLVDNNIEYYDEFTGSY